MAITAADIPLGKVRFRVVSVGGVAPGLVNFRFALDTPSGTITPITDESVVVVGSAWSSFRPWDLSGATTLLAQSPNAGSRGFPVLGILRMRFNNTPAPVVLEAEVVFDETPLVTWAVSGSLENSCYSANADCCGLGVVIGRDGLNVPYLKTVGQWFDEQYLDPVAAAALGPPCSRYWLTTHPYTHTDDIPTWADISFKLCRLGVNVSGMTPAKGSLIHQAILDAGTLGFEDGVLTVYSPQHSPFDYFATPDAQTFADAFAATWYTAYNALGQAGKLKLFQLQDEPVWYDSADVTVLKGNAAGVLRFQQYLEAVSGRTPADFGKASWSLVTPMGRGEAYFSVQASRTYYWTMRFLAQDMARWMGVLSQSFATRFGRTVYNPVDQNNFHQRFVTPGRAGQLAGVSPANAIMSELGVDPFLAARGVPSLGWPGFNILYSDPTFGDGNAWKWSIHGAQLRAAAKAGGITWGSYFPGYALSTGSRRYGWLTQIMAAAAQGCKVFHAYEAGPERFGALGVGFLDSDPVDGSVPKVQRLAEAATYLGRAESILYGAERVKAKVAVIKPRSSFPWDIQPVSNWRTSLTTSPGIGAVTFDVNSTGAGVSNYIVRNGGLLLLNPGGANEEVVSITAGGVSGIHVTISPGCVNAHVAGETVQVLYDPNNTLRDHTENDFFATESDYAAEFAGICWMLQHSAVMWDVLDEDAVIAGQCAGYGAVYFTEPDAPSALLDALVAYVQGGGCLVTFTQAGTRNGDDDVPLSTLAAAFGFSENPRLRTLIQSVAGVGTAGTVLGSGGAPASTTAYGPRATFASTAGCTIEGTWQNDGSPAVVTKAIGSGRVYHFGFFPGVSYAAGQSIGGATADQLPAGFDANLRAWLLRPLTLAGVAQDVTVSDPLVEVNLLRGTEGECLIIHNWSGVDLPNFSLTYHSPGDPEIVALASGGAANIAWTGGVLTAGFALSGSRSVEVLLLPEEQPLMAISVQTLTARAKRRYGYSSMGEDQLLNDQLFLDGINEVVGDLLELAGGMRETFTLNLPTTAQVALDERIVRIEDNTLRIDYNGDGQYSCIPAFLEEKTIRSVMGPVERLDPGPPIYWYGQRGSAAGSMLSITLVPRSDKAVVNGITFDARTVPAEVALPADLIPFRPSENSVLIPAVCCVIAQTEASRGRKDAPVAMWTGLYEQAKRDYLNAVEQSTRGTRRQVHYELDPMEWSA